MIKHTRRNRRYAFAGFFSSNTMVGVQSSVLANVSAGNRSAHILRMQPETLLLEDRVMPVVNLSVSDLTIVEGDAGTKDAVFTVTRSGKPDDLNVAFQVSFATQDGTGSDAAKAGVDYVANSGILTFQAGELTKTVNVAVIGNNILQGSRSFSLSVSNAQPLKGPQIQFGDVSYWQSKSPNWTDLMDFGDLNGDGVDEIIVKQMYAKDGGSMSDLNQLLIYDNKSASPDDPFKLDTSGNINSMQIVDINNDRLKDILIGSSDQILIYFGNGDLTYLQKSVLEISIIGGVNKVEAKDFDRDGILELVACNSIGTYLIKQDLNGDYTNTVKLFDGNTSDIIINDFNGDSRKDIVPMKLKVYANGAKEFFIDGAYINNGYGGFEFIQSETMYFQSGQTVDSTIISEDFNCDNIDDIAVNQTSSIFIIAGSDNGVLISKGYTNGLSYSNGEIASADFNQDGIPDIAVSSPAGILLGIGDFTFTERTQFQDLKADNNKSVDYTSGSIQLNRLDIYDWNKDGLPDVLTNEKALSIYSNNNTWHFKANPEAANTTSIYISSGMTTSNVPQFVFSENEGTGGFSSPIRIPRLDESPDNMDDITDLLSFTSSSIILRPVLIKTFSNSLILLESFVSVF